MNGLLLILLFIISDAPSRATSLVTRAQLPSEGIGHLEHPRIDARVFRDIAGVGQMMVAVLEAAGARMRLKPLHAAPEFEGVVEGGAIEYRYVPGRYGKAPQAGHEGMHALSREETELVAERAEGAHIGGSRSAYVGCRAGVDLV